MEFRAGEEQGFKRIWGHARVAFSETPAGETQASRAFVTPSGAVSWLCSVVDARNDRDTSSGRLDAFLRPPGMLGSLPALAVDINVPEVSGTDERGRAVLRGLLERYTRCPSIHVRFWYTERDDSTGRDRRVAQARPLAHLLVEDADPYRSRPTLKAAQELELETENMRLTGIAKCGAMSGRAGTVWRTLAEAQEATRAHRADLCGGCFAP